LSVKAADLNISLNSVCLDTNSILLPLILHVHIVSHSSSYRP